MKCNLADVWKHELDSRRRAQLKLLNETRRNEQQAIVLQLSDLGWVFSTEEHSHPHAGSSWTETKFRSPRMRKAVPYSIWTDLIRTELVSVAHDIVYDDAFRVRLMNKAVDAVAEYFGTNKQATPDSVQFEIQVKTVPHALSDNQ